MTWTAPAPETVDGPLTGPERPMLEGMLRWQRSQLLARCTGLTGEQLALASVPPSTLTLLGLVRHLAKVERIWLRQRMAGHDVPRLFDDLPGPDPDFALLDPTVAEAEIARWQEEIALGDAAVADLPLDHTAEVHGEPYALRLVYVHLIGEYAQHVGHADLIRERIDGSTGGRG